MGAAGFALQWFGNSFDSALMSKKGAYGSWVTGAIAGKGDTEEQDFPDRITSAERACGQLPQRRRKHTRIGGHQYY